MFEVRGKRVPKENDSCDSASQTSDSSRSFLDGAACESVHKARNGCGGS